MYKIFFFPDKKVIRYVSLPYLKFSDPLPESHLFFYFAISEMSNNNSISTDWSYRIDRQLIVKFATQNLTVMS